MRLRLRGKTDVGLIREVNEDSFGIVEDKHLAIVCDGMGGHAGGEVASKNAVDTISRLHSGFAYPAEADPAFDVPGEFSIEGGFLASTIRIANSRIFRKARAQSSLSGMGTTVVAALCHHDCISICHVGDSRAYRIKDNVLLRLTEDHSWVNELILAGQLSRDQARDFPNRNVITRALGVRETVKVDLREEKTSAGDLYLLCSDGLVGCMKDEEILDVVTAGGDDLNAIVDGLIEGAKSGGGDDNITVVLMQLLEVGSPLDRAAGPVSITFPEETESELTAQVVVSDVLDETENEPQTEPAPSNDHEKTQRTDTTDDTREISFWRLSVSLIILLITIVYVAYAFDIAGTKDFIASWLGLG